MIDWQSYGPIYTVAPGIKKIGELPIIEFDDEENRYLNLKRKAKENIYFDEIYTPDHDQIICKKIQSILSKEHPSKLISFNNFQELGFCIQEDLADSPRRVNDRRSPRINRDMQIPTTRLQRYLQLHRWHRFPLQQTQQRLHLQHLALYSLHPQMHL